MNLDVPEKNLGIAIRQHVGLVTKLSEQWRPDQHLKEGETCTIVEQWTINRVWDYVGCYNRDVCGGSVMLSTSEPRNIKMIVAAITVINIDPRMFTWYVPSGIALYTQGECKCQQGPYQKVRIQHKFVHLPIVLRVASTVVNRSQQILIERGNEHRHVDPNRHTPCSCLQ